MNVHERLENLGVKRSAARTRSVVMPDPIFEAFNAACDTLSSPFSQKDISGPWRIRAYKAEPRLRVMIESTRNASRYCLSDCLAEGFVFRPAMFYKCDKQKKIVTHRTEDAFLSRPTLLVGTLHEAGHTHALLPNDRGSEARHIQQRYLRLSKRMKDSPSLAFQEEFRKQIRSALQRYKPDVAYAHNLQQSLLDFLDDHISHEVHLDDIDQATAADEKSAGHFVRTKLAEISAAGIEIGCSNEEVEQDILYSLQSYELQRLEWIWRDFGPEKLHKTRPVFIEYKDVPSGIQPLISQ